MSNFSIITDSTAYIPADLVKKYDICVAPQVLIWGEQTFQDGVDITPKEFYQRLQKSTVNPTTSQVTPATFHKIFKKILDDGKDILAILISDKLSGTIASANQASEMLPGARIEVVDSNTTAMAMGFIVLAVAQAAQSGASLAECKALAQKAVANVGVVFAVDTLEFLHRGGRIGGGARFLGTALNIKPILELRDGRIEALERVRTRTKSLNRLIELVEERIAGRSPIHIATLHANAPEEAKNLLTEATNRLGAVESIFSDVSPVIGTHAGPGTVGLAYMAGL